MVLGKYWKMEKMDRGNSDDSI